MAKKNILSRSKIKKAIQCMSEGQYAQVIQLLRPFCKSNPRDLEAWMMLASAYGQQWDFVAAIECCQHVLSFEPANPHANSVMGNALAASGRHQEAQASFRKALESSPNDVGLLNNLGMALYLEGELEEAAEVFNKVLRLSPGYVNAHNNLGNVYRLLNRNMEAIQHFMKAVELNPDLLEAHLNLDKIFSDRVTRPDEAERCFKAALRLDPDNFEAYCSLSGTFRFRGRLEEALEAIREALRIRPNDPIALGHEAELFELQGQDEKAYAQARALTAADEPINLRAALIMTRQCHRNDACEEALDYARSMLDGENLLFESRRELHFALGKLFDKLGRYDEAFPHFQQGNDLIGVPCNLSEDMAYNDRLRSFYNRETLLQMPHARASSRSERMVFIIGMPRSGTSLTEQILASHPDIHAAGELNDINELASQLPKLLADKRAYPDCLMGLTVPAADRLAGRYLDKIDSLSHGAKRVTDKMPHNFMNLGLISLLFPGARVIHCQRDPRDTCLSLFMQDFGWLHPYSTRLDYLGAYYRGYQSIMEHWKSILDIPVMNIRYEDMVADQEVVSRALVDFAGLEWDERCLHFDKTKRFVPTASYNQVRQPIYRKSVQRWKNYETHLGQLLDALGDAVTTVQGNPAERAGGV